MSAKRPSLPPHARVTYQISAVASARVSERIAAALERHESVGAVGLFERGDGQFEVAAYFGNPLIKDTLIERAKQAAAPDQVAVRVETLQDADWIKLSQGRRGPVQVGRFLVHGRHDREHVPRHRFRIEIDAGLAFGTAHHASTRACLVALDELLKRRRFGRILDLGTGSAVLAIAAAKATGRAILASDADPVAVTVAEENARKNGVASLLRVVSAAGFARRELRQLRADLILANLLARPLVALAPELFRRMAPSGIAVLSGITLDQAGAVEARYRSVGFRTERRILLDGWAALVLTRPSIAKADRAIDRFGSRLYKTDHVPKIR